LDIDVSKWISVIINSSLSNNICSPILCIGNLDDISDKFSLHSDYIETHPLTITYAYSGLSPRLYIVSSFSYDR